MPLQYIPQLIHTLPIIHVNEKLYIHVEEKIREVCFKALVHNGRSLGYILHYPAIRSNILARRAIFFLKFRQVMVLCKVTLTLCLINQALRHEVIWSVEI
jgi:hypothetical protein